MTGKIIKVSDTLPPTNIIIAAIAAGPKIYAAKFNGSHFVDVESGNELALGYIFWWVDMSHYDKSELPLAFGALHAYLNVLQVAMKSWIEESKS